MKAGDLVRIGNEWVMHNPWMRDSWIDQCRIGLIVELCKRTEVASVLIKGKVQPYSFRKLEVVNGEV